MCNPRQVMIHLTRSIAEAWQHTIRQTAAAGGEAAELGRVAVDIRLDEEMGGAALEMLGRVLADGFDDFEPWEQCGDGRLRRALQDVTLVYDPPTGRLMVETRLTELISVEAQGAAEAAGFTVGEVAVEAVGRYYDDGWGGRTLETAESEAQAQAEQRLGDAVNALHRAQNPEAFEQAEAEAAAQAREAAREALRLRQAEVREAMRDRLRSILRQSDQQVFHTMNRAVGEAYRRTLLQLVKQNGGRVIQDERTGSVINMELELY